MTLKLDIEMFHCDSWKPIYFGVKRSKVKLTRHKKHCQHGSRCCSECWHLLASLLLCLYTARLCSICKVFSYGCRSAVVCRTQNFHSFVKVALTKQPKRRPTSDKLLEVSG